MEGFPYLSLTSIQLIKGEDSSNFRYLKFWMIYQEQTIHVTIAYIDDMDALEIYQIGCFLFSAFYKHLFWNILLRWKLT